MIPPAAVTWLSLIMTMSNRPMRWLAPPPANTPHLSKTRRAGHCFAGLDHPGACSLHPLVQRCGHVGFWNTAKSARLQLHGRLRAGINIVHTCWEGVLVTEATVLTMLA